MAVFHFLAALGEAIEDAYEETFDLFSRTRPLEHLGMVDPKAESVELSIGGRDYTIKQSPGLLQSSREGGTTGAAVWTSSVRLAEWFSNPVDNPCFRLGLLNERSIVLELGSGIAGIVPCQLAPWVHKGRVVATDQTYALKLLRSNIEANARERSSRRSGSGSGSGGSSGGSVRLAGREQGIDVLALDWEQDDIASFLTANGMQDGVDVVLASDTIYNYALIEPFVQTCVDVCEARMQAAIELRPATVCIVAQRLRQADVFEQWMQTALRSFRVWRIPHDMLVDGLRVEDGFVVHVLVLRADKGR